MHILSINFISFTAQIYKALLMQGKGRIAPPPLDPPMPTATAIPGSLLTWKNNLQKVERLKE